MEAVEEGAVKEGREGGENGKTRKNSESKKAIGIVFWNIARLERK